MSQVGAALRILLLPVPSALAPWELLVPAAAVAELVSIGPLEAPEPGAPNWLVGYFQWRDLRLPVVCPGREPAAPPPVYAAVCYAPSGESEVPVFSIGTPGMPRLEPLTPDALAPVELPPSQASSPFLQVTLSYRGRPTALVDLDALERAVLGAAVLPR